MAWPQTARTAALVLAALVGLLGLWVGGQYILGFQGSLGPKGAVLPPLLGLLTLSLTVSATVKKRMPSQTWRRWLVFVLLAVVGYVIARDAYSYAFYLNRPGGLAGGCYTQLELWLRVPRESWVRGMEQMVATTLFFASPLALLIGRGEGSK